MKTATPVPAVIAAIGIVCAVTLWFALRKERMADMVEQGQPGDPRHPVSLPADPGAQARLAVVAPPAEPSINGAGSSFSPTPDMAARMAVIGMGPNRQEHLKERLKDPEFRRTFHAQLRADIGRLYPGLDELDLTEIESEKLFDVLADSQLARAEDGYILGGKVNLQEVRAKQEEFDRLQDEAIQAQLGGKYAQWLAYRHARSARTQVAAIDTQLANAGRPLTEEQSRALTEALIAEQQLQEQEASSLPRTERSNRMEENKRRTLDAVARHVDADQFAVLRNDNP